MYEYYRDFTFKSKTFYTITPPPMKKYLALGLLSSLLLTSC